MPASLDLTFSALADPTRRAILAALATRGEASVGEIAAPFAMSLPAVSKHLDVLEEARLLRRERNGRKILCRLEPGPMEAAMRWLRAYESFWTRRLDALAAYLEETPWPDPPTSPSPSSAPSRRRRKRSSPPGRTRKR